MTLLVPTAARMAAPATLDAARCPARPHRTPSTRQESDGPLILDVVGAPDEVLVARLAAGDDEALAEAYGRYAGIVFGIARRTTGSRAAAEDVVQEVFCGLWSRPEGFDPARGSLRAYLGTMAHRRAVDHVRRETRRGRREDRSQALEPPSGACDPGGMDAAVLSEVVREAISRLPDDQREAVELAYWQGRTRTEIAEQLGIPEGTAKSRLRLAHAKLVRWLGDLAVEPA